MRLRKIELDNYRNHGHSVLELGDTSFVVIRGSNHAGKSSIRDSISMALASTSSSLDPLGREFKRKIKRNADKAVVKVDIEGDKHTVQQCVTLNTNTSGRVPRSKCLDDPDWKPLPFDNFLTRYKDALLVAVNTDYFLHKMGEKEQKALLAKLALPERYDFPKDTILATYKALRIVNDEIEKMLKGEIPATPQAMAGLKGYIDFDGEPFSVIDKAYKLLYQERSLVNRQVKDFVIPDPPPAAAPGVDSYSLQQELEAARAERRKIDAEKDAAVHAATDVSVKRGKLQTKIENLREKCREIKTMIDGVASSILSPEKLAELQKIVQNHAKCTELRGGIADADKILGEYNEALKRWQSMTGDNLRCGECDQRITKEYVDKSIKDTQELLTRYVDRKAILVEELKTLGDMDGAVLAIEHHEKAANERDAYAKTLDEKVKEGKAAVEELKALGEPIDVAAQFVEPLKQIDARINGLIEQLRPVIAAEERAKEIKIKKEVLEKLEKQAATLDELVKYFDKDGIKAKLLAEHVGGFERKINETMSAFDYKCSLSIEPYDFQVTNSEGDSCPVTELSDSEELMFGVAFQGAVSRAAGIGFIVADRMETFDIGERQKANRCLYRMATDGTLEQVVLIMTDKSTEVPKLPNSKFFFVEKGTVKELRSE